MKDLTPKLDDTAGAQGQLAADEFNDFANDVQNAIIESGQSLTAGVGDDNLQLHKALATGGKRRSLGNGATAALGDIVVPDNAGGAMTWNLPSTGLFQGARVFQEQAVNQPFSTNNVTVGRNGNDIMGLSEDMLMNSLLSDNTFLAFEWVAGSQGWKVIVIGVVGRTL